MKKHCRTCEWFVFDKYCELEDTCVWQNKKACMWYHKREKSVVVKALLAMIYLLLISGFIFLKQRGGN